MTNPPKSQPSGGPAVTPTRMSEFEMAVRLANLILERPSGDPDEDLAILSRTLLRTIEKLNAQAAAPPNSLLKDAELITTVVYNQKTGEITQEKPKAPAPPSLAHLDNTALLFRECDKAVTSLMNMLEEQDGDVTDLRELQGAVRSWLAAPPTPVTLTASEIRDAVFLEWPADEERWENIADTLNALLTTRAASPDSGKVERLIAALEWYAARDWALLLKDNVDAAMRRNGHDMGSRARDALAQPDQPSATTGEGK